MSENNVKVALVTGSNKGLGFSIVKRLCQDFKGVVYLTSRNEERGREAIKELEKLGLKANYHQLDIENQESINNLAAYLKQTYGGLDVLINNAAVAKISPNDPIDQQAVYCNSINFVGTLNVCKALFPILKPNARVVNISSRMGMLSWVKSKELKEKLKSDDLKVEEIVKIMTDFVEACKKGKPDKEGFAASPYGMSKVCVTAMTRVHQQEFDREEPKRNIVINSCCPGYVKTDMTGQWGLINADQGADTPVYLALLPEDFSGPKGEFWAERTLVDWKEGSLLGEALKKTPFVLRSLFSK